MNKIKIDNLISIVQEYNVEDISLITKAYELADNLHSGQIRESGEPYITHPLNVAYTLAQMHADKDTICAALLHDTLEDTNICKEELAELFGRDVANLVDGVTKISKMNFSSKKDQNLANTRKIILGITTDVRIIIIKLADRLHNMKTLSFKSEIKQKENALETMEIFVPLAYYIGAYGIKNELEDLSFMYLKPKEYGYLKEKIDNLSYQNGVCLNELSSKIDEILSNENIHHQIKYRIKNLYGIYKQLNKGRKIGDIHDLLAIKVLVDEVETCYKTLYLIHKNYNPINNKFKDYICNPKTNLYSSLHTTIFGPNDKLIQTQIRTFDMDKIALYGLTAYWDINKGNARDKMQKDLSERFQFFKSLTDINVMFKDNQEFVTQIKNELFSDKIYIYISNGQTIELPKGSNIVDLGCYLGIENILVGAKVNEEIVPIEYILKNKDRVIMITDEFSYGYRDEWKEKANTSYAKKKIDIKKNNVSYRGDTK